MSKTPPPNPWLPPQQEALPRYLDALLRETWDAPVTIFEPVDLVPSADAMKPAVEIPATDPITQAATPSSAAAVPGSVDTVVPWAAAPFEAQLFHVAGLTLALPLSQLVGIVDSMDVVAAGTADPPWLRGRLCYPHGEILVTDTAHWVLPTGTPRPVPARGYPVLIIAEGRWGLACERVGSVVILDPTAVRWRSARTQRRWLAGMVSQPSCALLDPVQLAVLFTEALGADT